MVLRGYSWRVSQGLLLWYLGDAGPCCTRDETWVSNMQICTLALCIISQALFYLGRGGFGGVGEIMLEIQGRIHQNVLVTFQKAAILAHLPLFCISMDFVQMHLCVSM